jgi:hypothetical protein
MIRDFMDQGEPASAGRAAVAAKRKPPRKAAR